MALRLNQCLIENDPGADREPMAIIGWPLKTLARLDRDGAHGLVASLSFAGVLSRQAAFVIVATVDLAAPERFLRRLGIQKDDAAGIGFALRSRRARDIVAAAFDVEANDVPTGYLRAVAKIAEAGADRSGLHPFADPASYRRLFEVLVEDRHGRRAHALRYCDQLRSSTIAAALTLDPVLVWPEVLAVIGSPQRVETANAMLALIRDCHTAIDERALVTALRQSAKSLGVLEAFARKALDTADRLPAPLPAAEGVRPLRTAADYRETGVKLRNCAATKTAEVALGLLAVVEVTHRAEDGAETVVAVSLTPTTDGRWLVSEAGGLKNRRPPAPVIRDVLRRMQALGAIIPDPGRDSPYRADLANLMGVYRYAPLDDALHADADDDMADAVDALAAEMGDAA